MGGVAFLVPTLILIAASVIVVKVGTVALRMTGLDAKRARFQALSAFTGTGFTTRDSELVVRDDRRRRIIMTLMVLGNAGFVTVLATLIGSFVLVERAVQIPIHIVAIVICIYLIYRLGRRRRLMRKWSEWIERKLARWTSLQEIPIEEAFHLAEGHGVASIRVRPDSEVIGHSLAEKALAGKGVVVLAIEREGGTIASPKADEVIQRGDRLICYGRIKVMREIL
jgi:small-conductance mechanosensitive channel